MTASRLHSRRRSPSSSSTSCRPPVTSSFQINSGRHKGEYRLAYLQAEGAESEAQLAGIVAAAESEGAFFVLIPDGVSARGVTHVHMLMAIAKRPAADESTHSKKLSLQAYVNLVLVQQGAASARDHRVGDGSSTRFVLEALRKLDRHG